MKVTLHAVGITRDPPTSFKKAEKEVELPFLPVKGMEFTLNPEDCTIAIVGSVTWYLDEEYAWVWLEGPQLSAEGVESLIENHGWKAV